MIKKIIQSKLAKLATQIIRVHKPEVIAITGSVGKTSTKEAIAAVMGAHFNIRSTYKNYNNEFGLPLTIIGQSSPGRSLSGWREVLRQGKALAGSSDSAYPEMLVLEMGIDHPGDMDHLVSIAPPSRAVITRLGTAHAEFFSSIPELHAEKMKLARALGDTGCLIYNADDTQLKKYAAEINAISLGYGFDPRADVGIDGLRFTVSSERPETSGATFKLLYQGSAVPVSLPGIISRPAVLSALAAAAVGLSYGLNAIDIAMALRSFSTPSGRMRPLASRYGGLIIDDTYNASPEAVAESLETVASIDRGQYNQNWIVLGTMRELGAESERSHASVGEQVAALKPDRLVTVGDEAALIAKTAIAAGMDEAAVRHFDHSEAAADFIESEMADNDLVLVKGSQAVRMEKIVKRLMKEPERAEELLVRQGKEWQD